MYIGKLSKGDEVRDAVVAEEGATPPFRSKPVPTIIRPLMTEQGLLLQLQVPPEVFEDYEADASGDIVVQLVPEEK